MKGIIRFPDERNRTVPTALAAGVLLIGLVYVLANVYLVPYPGFDYDGNWNVVSLAIDCPNVSRPAEIEWCRINGDLLQVGDHILAVTDLQSGEPTTFEEYVTDPTYTPFWGAEAGDIISMRIARNGEQQQIGWPINGPSPSDRIRRMAALILFLPFWLAGTATLLFLRPRDARWYGLILFNFLTGLWLAIGTISVSHVLASSILTTALSWLLMPAFLHLHFFIARPELGARLKRWVMIGYGSALILGISELAGILPARTSYLALLIAVLGSAGLLIVRMIQPSARRTRIAMGLMGIGIGLAILPGALFWLVPTIFGIGHAPSLAVTALSTLAIPILPLFYFYALYKHRLGNLEVRANRALTQYSFLILFATGFVLAFVLLNRRSTVDSSLMIYSLVLSVAFLIVSLLLRPVFNRFVNRVAYGTTYEPETLIRQFANEIPRTLSRQQLSSVLMSEVMPSLLIRQSALLWLHEEENPLIYSDAVPSLSLPLEPSTRDQLLSAAGRFLPEDQSLPSPFSWVRLVVPIVLDSKPVGLWLLGRRDPDDFYPMQDVELLMTLGNQVGVALETTRLFAIQQKRTEELENAYYQLRQADRLKNAFIRNITHELRTPLTAIAGYTDLLSDGDAGDLSEMQQEMLEIVSARTADLIQLINDIITFQETKLQKEDGNLIDLRAIAETAVHHAQLMAEKDSSWRPRPHQITLNCDELTPLIWGNHMQMGQVFTNLLQNAVKFSPNGGAVAVRIVSGPHEFRLDNDNTEYLNGDATVVPGYGIFVSVSDEGIGIPEDELENIWQDFYQIDGSATRRFGGTGLGLALVRDIVEAHGGSIWVESVVDQGSVFTFVLPRHERKEPVPSQGNGLDDMTPEPVHS